jgi:hypothetical protein
MSCGYRQGLYPKIRSFFTLIGVFQPQNAALSGQSANDHTIATIQIRDDTHLYQARSIEQRRDVLPLTLADFHQNTPTRGQVIRG